MTKILAYYFNVVLPRLALVDVFLTGNLWLCHHGSFLVLMFQMRMTRSVQ